VANQNHQPVQPGRPDLADAVHGFSNCCMSITGESSMGMNFQITMPLILIFIFVVMCTLVGRTAALKPAAVRSRQHVAKETKPFPHR
jgi:hypothetical protein